MTTVRLCHLYPDQMNIYADRGNIAVLERRLHWRGHSLAVTGVGPGEAIPPAEYDLLYLGGGQDRDQELVALDLVDKAERVRAMAADGTAMLFVCGGYQLAGAGYESVAGSQLPGVGVLDVDTTAGADRLIGDIVIDGRLGEHRGEVVGYENHAGRTTLGPDATPLGRVRHGHGNDGSSGREGAVQGRVVGTYIHGPLLPKNSWLADVLLGWALDHAGDPAPLDPLDDDLEQAAHIVAVARAGIRR